MTELCPVVNLVMAKYQLYINLEPVVAKFLAFHEGGEPNNLSLSKNSHFGAFILSKLSKPTANEVVENFKGNCLIEFPAQSIKELQVSIHRGGVVCLTTDKQIEINEFFRKFMNHHVCLEIDALHEISEIKDRILSIRKKYNFTEDELSFDAVQKAYYRFRKQNNKRFFDNRFKNNHRPLE